MSPDRWHEIESLYHVARTWEPGARAHRLAAACVGDADLLREVTELLKQDDVSGQLLDRRAWTSTASGSMPPQDSGLRPGVTLGAYEIQSELGAGGMGEVWKAIDRRLDRAVAIKMSRAQFSDRVEREAKAVAALNHPNIGALYDVGIAPSGLTYLVLEYVEGLTLADRIGRGPLPADDVAHIARQIADAIEAAHDRAIVHRDLKPANIKLRPDGTIKVLDFGLAKALDYHDTLPTGPEVSAPGLITGTAAYMSPEQARGDAVDKRADIWAFGVIVYEMLTGQRPFQGESVPETLTNVLKIDPGLSQLPPRFRLLVRHCLEKDPRKRLRDIGDAMRLLFIDGEQGVDNTGKHSRWLWVGAAAASAAAVVPLVLLLRQTPTAAPAHVSFQIIPPGISTYEQLALAPDGTKLAFSGTGFDGVSRLWVRSFDSVEARSIPEAEGITGQPIWSPDSRSIAFASGAKLRKIDAAGGPPLTLCDWSGNGQPLTGAWGTTGVIVFSRPGGGLTKVASTGGVCSDVTSAGSSPSFLPDGRHFVYLRTNEKVPPGAYLGSVDTAPAQQPSEGILPNAFSATYVPSTTASRGYLVFNLHQATGPNADHGTLMAQPFDPQRLKLSGQPVNVPVSYLGGFGNAANSLLFSMSSMGTIAYSSNGTGRYQNVWYDRTGKMIGTAGDPGDYGDVMLSPDGGQAMYHNREGMDDLWLFDISRRVSTRLTLGPDRDHQGVWSPDGRYVMWGMQQGLGSQPLYVKASNGAGEEHLVTNGEPGSFNVPDDWSPDGRYFLYAAQPLRGGPATASGVGYNLWALPVRSEGAAAGPAWIYLANPLGVGHARFAPDGHWVAYTIGTGAAQNVYVSPFPMPDGRNDRWAISSGGGYQPIWTREGKELLYLSPDNRVISVDVVTDGTTFRSGTQTPLFTINIAGGSQSAPTHRWDVTKDGQRFLVVTVLDVTQSPPITVETNWESGLKP